MTSSTTSNPDMAYRHQLSDPSMACVPSVIYVKDDSINDNMAVIQDFRDELEMKNYQIEALGERVEILEQMMSSCSATTAATPPSRKTSLGLSSPSVPRCKPTCPTFQEKQASEPPSLPSTTTTTTTTQKRPSTLDSERLARVLENVYVPPNVISTPSHDRTNSRSTLPMAAVSKESMYFEAYQMLQAMTIAEEADIKASFEPINKILPREREIERRRKSPRPPAA